jgi:hypothetical protein
MENYSEAYAQMSTSPLAVILSLACSALVIIAMWKIFTKANVPGWGAIVPFYNAYLEFKITWGDGWKFLLMLIPIANIVIAIITMVKLAKAFGKGSGFAVGLILLPVIFVCILGFGKATYQGVPAKE